VLKLFCGNICTLQLFHSGTLCSDVYCFTIGGDRTFSDCKFAIINFVITKYHKIIINFLKMWPFPNFQLSIFKTSILLICLVYIVFLLFIYCLLIYMLNYLLFFRAVRRHRRAAAAAAILLTPPPPIVTDRRAAAAAADRMSASRRRRFRDVFTLCCTPAICC